MWWALVSITRSRLHFVVLLSGYPNLRFSGDSFMGQPRPATHRPPLGHRALECDGQHRGPSQSGRVPPVLPACRFDGRHKRVSLLQFLTAADPDVPHVGELCDEAQYPRPVRQRTDHDRRSVGPWSARPELEVASLVELPDEIDRARPQEGNNDL